LGTVHWCIIWNEHTTTNANTNTSTNTNTNHQPIACHNDYTTTAAAISEEDFSGTKRTGTSLEEDD
jgi:hypothetical protein